MPTPFLAYPFSCLIAREAGATLTGYNGDAFNDWLPKFCVSSTPKLHETIIAHLAD
ncbi:hypothetical protein [Neorhodopirellula lusitana]|uniref:hypothetical protein n=1 Tax=Neorhodopirellula lusitana TaxID=445327 RepID=UPI0024B70867|nr:hypothetical protein [Neorhodopirellula lusitana]